MDDRLLEGLSRRERQIMDIVYRHGSVSAAEVQEELADDPSYSTVRALMRILEEKGFLKHKCDGQKYIYSPAVSKKNAMKQAVSDLLKTFFNNSVEQAVSALLESDASKLKNSDYDRLSQLIEKARKEEADD
ncbi:MAG: BlaI/MecI/CopY family transcriptional regulator, partial [Clostridia bacterium]|nr:BlaI/MecI/CopY family transcriptional regulator [Clostridia bacterium]